MNFSVNQFRHLYVATTKGTVNEQAAAGTIDVKNDNAKTHVYFPYMGLGGQMRSDLIKTENILYAKITDAASMGRNLKAVNVQLKGAPAAGQDYILKIKYNQFVGLSDEDNYFEYGEVHTDTNTSDTTFYKKLAISLAKNTAKQGLVTIKVGDVVVTPLTKESDITDTSNGITIVEKEQDWVLGTKEQVPVFFEVYDTPVMVAGEETQWANITDAESGVTLTNGTKIADLEYFCMGERGDIYRNVGWPNVIPTKYMIGTAGKGKSYHVLDIHYAFVGANEAVQKSEKDITIVCEDKAQLKAIYKAFEEATGVKVALPITSGGTEDASWK